MRDDLYEQCSDHMTEKIPSSTKLGSRPSSSFIRSNSCCVRLWAAITSAVIIAQLTLLNHLFDRLAQLGRVNASDVFVNNFALLVEQVRRGQIPLPPAIDQIDRGLGIRNVQQVRRHRRLHLLKKLRHAFVDLSDVVERDGEKLERVRTKLM